MIEMLDFFPLIFAIGQFGLDFIFRENTPSIFILDFVSIGIGVASLVLPMKELNKKLFPLDEEDVPELQVTFDQART